MQSVEPTSKRNAVILTQQLLEARRASETPNPARKEVKSRNSAPGK